MPPQVGRRPEPRPLGHLLDGQVGLLQQRAREVDALLVQPGRRRHPGLVPVHGLVDVATVPPVIELCRRVYGESGPVVFGWANAAHLLGAGASAFLGATARDVFGAYDVVWVALSAGRLVAALLAPAVRATLVKVE
ncbi:hypothetical protein AMK21_04330 [Streptomyces sp. CB00316]|nr:hypothetical protein AMK21_04330 [Streptomyces sp. CB00316]